MDLRPKLTFVAQCFAILRLSEGKTVMCHYPPLITIRLFEKAMQLVSPQYFHETAAFYSIDWIAAHISSGMLPPLMT